VQQKQFFWVNSVSNIKAALQGNGLCAGKQQQHGPCKAATKGHEASFARPESEQADARRGWQGFHEQAGRQQKVCCEQ